jgi:DNA-3-methyladenine glycosylase II
VADKIWERVKELLDNEFSAEKILNISEEKLRGTGLSRSKAVYFKEAAKAQKRGRLESREIEKMTDEQVVERLIEIKGIGRWSAEMIMIFTLGREDVFSVGDLGLRTAVCRLYGVQRDDWEAIEKISLKWRPYRSIASRYLWKSLDNV